VAAAVRVAVVCRESEIDGEVFCAGLELMGVDTGSTLIDTDLTLFDTTPPKPAKPSTTHTWGLLSTAAFLIKGASFRRNRASGIMETYSLNIRPLLELIHMFHDRDATDRRDKIFALLGMSSDTPSGISADYNVSWSDIFHRLTASVVGGQAVIKTEEDHEIVIIRTPFRILGTVSKVSQRSKLDHTQEVEIRLARGIRATTISSVTSKSLMGMAAANKWRIPTSVVSVREGDIACLFEGATQPTIMRPYHRYMHCVIIAITMTPTVATQKKPPQGLPTVEGVSLVWDWNFSDRGEANKDAMSSQRPALHFEVANRSFGLLPRSLPEMAFEAASWSRLAFRTENRHEAVAATESFFSRLNEVDEKNTFQFLAAIDMIRNMYREFGADFAKYHPKIEGLAWMADTLRST
jgi:hypothetical protein